MKVSLCVTIYNEESSISALIDSLLSQTKKPDEIIIVDGGSLDKTVEIVRHYQKKDKRIKLVIEPGSIAHGRNTSIELAKYPIIASIDAGCIAKNDWLEKITQPFINKEIGLVAGFYHMGAKNSLQQAMVIFHGVPPQRFDPENFLPSARSVAFRKDLWLEVGGYSEKLAKTGEDTLFFYNIVKTKTRIARVEEAVVYWEDPKNYTLLTFLKKSFEYAKGDAEVGILWHPSQRFTSHNIKVVAIFARYIVGLILFAAILFRGLTPLLLLVLIFLYLFWSIWKWRDVIKDMRVRLWLPVVQVTSDLAVMLGFVAGLTGRYNRV
jgi:glycosyltransferase involved in cell wall biosynthesis